MQRVDPCKLKAARMLSGMTQAAVAEELNSCDSLISHYEHGKKVPPPDKLMAMATLYNVKIDMLFS